MTSRITFGTFSVNYYVGVDGLSILLVLLTTFIMPLAIMFWPAAKASMIPAAGTMAAAPRTKRLSFLFTVFCSHQVFGWE